MYCSECGKQLAADNNFCSSCGSKILKEVKGSSNILTNENLKVEEKITEKSNSVLMQLVSVGSLIVAFIVGKFLGLITFVFLGAFLIGQWFPGWYTKKYGINHQLVKWVAWSNVISWLLPPIGLLIGTATYIFSDLVTEGKKKYRNLAIIGLILTLINAIVGILIRL